MVKKSTKNLTIPDEVHFNTELRAKERSLSKSNYVETQIVELEKRKIVANEDRVYKILD